MREAGAPGPLDIAPERLGPRLAAFLGAHWGRPVGVSDLERFPTGMSWITFGFTATIAAGDGGPATQRALIARIGDPAGLLAPYRARPEFLVLSALAAVPQLPIPEAIVFSDDAAAVGAPILVTARVDGDTPAPWKGQADRRGDAVNRSLGEDFADALGRLHGFDWRATPLGALWGEVDPNTVAREQVRHWARHAGLPNEAGQAAPVPPSPHMHYAMRWLERHAPVAERIAIVHGDYRVGNFLQHGGRITAILDWELVHAGDPHEDIAWAGLRTFAGGTGRVGGLIGRDEFLARHAARAGFVARPETVRYYEVLVQFKMAAMLIGATRRIESGQAHDVRMAAMGFQLAPTLLELNRLIAEAA